MTKLRSVFISDTHLGAPHAHAGELAVFLSTLACEKLYLVGDIVDLWWVARKRVCWTKNETRALDLLRKLPKRGIEVIYIPGNHDAALRTVGGQLLAGIQVQSRTEHLLLTGQRLLVTHGDQFDRYVRFDASQKALGEVIYDGLLSFDAFANAMRKRFGVRRFSLASWIKSRNSKAQQYLDRFEEVVINYARSKGFDGAVCGHIHRANLRESGGFAYANCGDWVENLTAIAEDEFGNLIQLKWTENTMHAAATIENTVMPELLLAA